MAKKRAVPKIDPNVVLEPDEIKIGFVASKYVNACAASRNVMHDNYHKDMDRRFCVQQRIAIEAKKASEKAVKKSTLALDSNTVAASQVAICGEYIKTSTNHVRTSSISVMVAILGFVVIGGISIFFNIRSMISQKELVTKFQEKIDQDSKNQDRLEKFLKVYIPILKGMKKGGK